MTTETDRTSATTNGVSPGREALDALLEAGRERGYKLDWALARDTLGADVLAMDAQHGGLLLQDLEPDVEVPDRSDNQTGRPRGARVRPAAPRIGTYSIRTQSDIWL